MKPVLRGMNFVIITMKRSLSLENKTFSLDLFTTFLYGMISKFDECKKGKSTIF